MTGGCPESRQDSSPQTKTCKSYDSHPSVEPTTYETSTAAEPSSVDDPFVVRCDAVGQHESVNDGPVAEGTASVECSHTSGKAGM